MYIYNIIKMKKPLNKISIFLIIAMLWHNAARANPAFSTRLSRDTLRPSVAIGDETLRGALTENAGLPHIISYLPPDTKRTKIIATVGPSNIFFYSWVDIKWCECLQV